tara:strand:+ start:1198 stop:1458 length:261 start_codon:yes stop_codon:yes gene_type:complete
MKQQAAFKHLLHHFRATKGIVKQTFSVNSTSLYEGNNHAYELALARCVGALDCLYWQAMGNGLVNLGKGIRRYTHKLKAHVQVDYL